MKRFLSLLLALTVVMMSMVIVPMSASAVEISVSDNFDNSTAIDTTKWYVNKSTDYTAIVENSTFDTDGTGKSVKMGGVIYNRFGYEFDEAITSGSLNIKFDAWVPSDWASDEIKLNLTNASGTETTVSRLQNKYVYTGGKEANNWDSWSAAGDVEYGAWTTVDYTLNIDTKEVSFKVAQETTGKSWTKSGTYVDADGTTTATNLSSVAKIEFTGMNATYPVYIDNLSVKYEKDVKIELPISDNFDDSTTIDTTKWFARFLGNTDRIAIAENSTFDTDGTGKSVMMTGTTYNNFGIDLDEAITTGTLNVNFDMWVPTDYTEEIKFNLYNNDGTATQVSSLRKDNIYTGGKEQNNWNSWSIVGDFEKGAWTTVDYKLNIDTKEVTYTVTQETGQSWTKSGKYIDADGTNTATNLSNVKKIELSGHNPTQKIYIDNLSASVTANSSGGDDSGDTTPEIKLPVTDNFDDSTAIDTTKWYARFLENTDYIAIAENSTFDTGATGKSVKMGGVLYNRFGVEPTAAITTGNLNVKFDMWVPSNATEEVKLMLYNNEGTATQVSSMRSAYVYTGGKEENNWDGYAGVGNLEKGAWTNVDYTLNLDTKEVTFKVTQESGQIYTKSGKYVDKDGTNTATNLSNIKKIELEGHNTTQTVYIDNFSVSMVESISGGDDSGDSGDEPGTTVETKIPVSDTFNDSTKVNTTKWNKVSKADVTPGSTIIDGTSYGADGNVLKLDGPDYNNFGVKLDKALPGDAFKVTFDVYVPQGFKSEMKLNGGDGKALLYLQKDGYMALSNGVGAVGTLPANTWSTIEYICDVDTGFVKVTAIPKGGNAMSKAGTYTLDLSNTNEIYLQGMYMQANSDHLLIDNLSIESYVIPAVELPIIDDFSGEAINTEKWNNISATSSQVYLEDGAVHIGDIYQHTGLGVALDEPITSGKIQATYDVYVTEEFMTQTEVKDGVTKASESEFLFYIGDKFADATAFTWLKPSVVTAGGLSGSLFKPTADTWYTFDLIYNVSTKEFTLVVTNKETGEQYTKAGTSTKDIKTISQIGFGMKWASIGTKAHVLLDNVSLTRYYEVPKMESVTFVKYDDTTSTALTNVAAGTKEIVVKFNTPMDDTTLSSTSMKLEKVEGTVRTAVEYEGVYDETAITWTIPLNEYLDAASTYELTMTADVKNGAGTKAAETTYEIGTDAGEYVVDISVMKGETEITALSQITKGDTLTIKADVINTTGKDQKLQLIYGGYNGKLLIDYKGYTKDIAKTDKKVEIKDFTVTVDPTNMTQIRLFDWYDFATLKCLSEADTIQ